MTALPTPCPRCVGTVVDLLGRLEKHRALTDEESLLLERAIRSEQRQHRACGARRVYVAWDHRMDRELAACHTASAKREFAVRHNIRMDAVYTRIKRLKARQNAK